MVYSSVRMMSRCAAAWSTAALLLFGVGCSSSGNDPDSCASALLPGDLVVTEFLIDAVGPDSGNEWFEIYNNTDATLRIGGLTLVKSRADGDSDKSHRIGALEIDGSAYLVLGNVTADVLPDHVDYGYGDDLGDFTNDDGRVRLVCGTTVIDEAVYQNSTEGRSRGFDGTVTPDHLANDNLTTWCDAVTPLTEDTLATPGIRNDPCFGGAPTTCEEDGVVRDVIPPVPGDLIITEFMPNPEAVGDTAGEWFEVFVQNSVDLNGLQIGKVFGEDPDAAINAVECLPAAGGTYLLFAANGDETTNGGLPPIDHIVDISLSNSGSSLYLSLGGELLDQVTWASSAAGAATNLDPSRFDVAQNDDEGSFCDATEAYGAGDLGTPGAANTMCDIEPPQGMCEDNGDLRAVVEPGAGDLVITEFMANPAAVADADGEWFEVYVAADVDLNGLELGRVVGDVDETVNDLACLRVTAGTYLTFARGDDDVMNGGIPSVDFLFGFSLVNNDGGLFLGTATGVVDEITWASSTMATATSLDANSLDATSNDDPGNWCDAVAPYGDGDLGTPGSANPACGGGGDGTCLENDVPRDVVEPQAGDLVITEFMPNPAAVADADGEWFEVLVSADVDLNGLQIGQTFPDVSTTINDANCLSVSSGTYVVFARDADGMINGGIPSVDFVMNVGITNSSGELFVGVNDALLDAIAWTSSTAGAATSLDPDNLDDTANDNEANWCAAVDAYGDGDLGTPGTVNPQCP